MNCDSICENYNLVYINYFDLFILFLEMFNMLVELLLFCRVVLYIFKVYRDVVFLCHANYFPL